jgi:vancomycin permeability regulator SanA
MVAVANSTKITSVGASISIASAAIDLTVIEDSISAQRHVAIIMYGKIERRSLFNPPLKIVTSQKWSFNRRPLFKVLTRVTIGSLGLLIGSMAVIAIAGSNDRIARSDVAVVLGNTVEPNGKPSARLQARLAKTIQLYQQGVFKNTIVSGGVGKEGVDEAVVMKQYLVAHGLPTARIYVDSQGNNTYLTAKHTAQLMTEHKWQSAVAISQYFHLPRTQLALQRFGVKTVYTAHADFFELRDLYSTLREVFSYCSYQLRSFS